MPHVTMHELPRLLVTLAEWTEFPGGIVAQIQGAKPNATVENHYRRRPIALLRLWHEKIEAWILEEAEGGTTNTSRCHRPHCPKASPRAADYFHQTQEPIVSRMLTADYFRSSAK